MSILSDYLNESLAQEVINQGIDFVKTLPHTDIDLENHKIVVPFSKGTTEEDLMQEGMLGYWFVNHGFNVFFEYGDYEYTTKPTWTNYKGWNRASGHTAYLRNRTIMTITWR